MEGGGGPPAAGGRGGGGAGRRGGAAVLPPLGKVAGPPGDLVHEVPVGAGVDAAEDVWPPGYGPNLPRMAGRPTRRR